MIRTIKLFGELAKQTGVETLELDVDTPRMAILGLNALVPNFEETMRGLNCPINVVSINTLDKEKSKGYDKKAFQDDFEDADEICIVPDISGAGAETVAYLIMTYEFSYMAAVAITIALNVAVAYALGSVASMLAPKPDTAGGSQRADQKPSFIFNGPINVSKQGYPVPLVYGTCLVGSIVMSSAVDVVDLA